MPCAAGCLHERTLTAGLARSFAGSSVSDEQQKEIQAKLDALSNRKGVTLSPAERWELPQSSNQVRRATSVRRRIARSHARACRSTALLVLR